MTKSACQQESQVNGLSGPPEKYELLRRRIFSNTKDFWCYVRSEMDSLSRVIKKPGMRRMNKMRGLIDEHYRSSISDVANLTEVDGYSIWRQKEFIYLSNLIQKRIRHLQNPPDCDNAKKLVCKINNVRLVLLVIFDKITPDSVTDLYFI